MANSVMKKPLKELFKQSVRKIQILNYFKENNKKGNYQIAICQNGKFAVAFDTGKNTFHY